MTLLEKTTKNIDGLDIKAMEQARKRWNSVAKPLKSLGLLEDAIIQIAGITGNSQIEISKKAVVIFCGDNGIVEEGVTQTGQEVTAVVTENFSKGESCVCIMAEQAGAWVFPVDIGVKRKLLGYGNFAEGNDRLVCSVDSKGASKIRYPIWNQKLMAGTRNFIKEPAMDREIAVKAIETGIRLVGLLKERGYQIIATGEMGIGNTTTSSAVSAAFLRVPPEMVTGRGAGLSTEGLKRKRKVIYQGLSLWKPNPEDGIDVIAKVGGLDLAGLTGIYLGGACYRVPVIVDGLISSVAALAAVSLCPMSKYYMIASHASAEIAGELVLNALGLKPIIYGNLCLGEGTGAVALLPVLDMAAAVYHKMSTFSQMQIKEYQPLD
ncbi:MAG: nicotinate-nucleotide--dimethylbenzimidazole phosphoribosyltransferase [Lachnospiraceae bacterium]|jgi:nicotinate-nucleotide--dimethylbenzimidazole phosphoribosyltransferase|nr:nicotinate-nucleotide--dimethylbenzimidazole phosphoribosyltransferase [Lachnospiraceae bacterium]